MPETENEEQTQSAETIPPKSSPKALAPQSKAESAPRMRSKAFRSKLLARLPRIAAPKWDSNESLNLYQDFRGFVDLDPDAFLRPLEPLAEDRRG